MARLCDYLRSRRLRIFRRHFRFHQIRHLANSEQTIYLINCMLIEMLCAPFRKSTKQTMAINRMNVQTNKWAFYVMHDIAYFIFVVAVGIFYKMYHYQHHFTEWQKKIFFFAKNVIHNKSQIKRWNTIYWEEGCSFSNSNHFTGIDMIFFSLDYHQCCTH